MWCLMFFFANSRLSDSIILPHSSHLSLYIFIPITQMYFSCLAVKYLTFAGYTLYLVVWFGCVGDVREAGGFLEPPQIGSAVW